MQVLLPKQQMMHAGGFLIIKKERSHIFMIRSAPYNYDLSLIYRKIYLHTNSTASTYIRGVIFLALPQITLIIT